MTKTKPTPLAGNLSALLSNTYVLAIKTQNYHWNVMDEDFRALHAFFEELYDALLPAIDLLAERLRKLGQFSPGSMTEMLRLTNLTEDTGHNEPAATMIANLLADHQHMIRHCKMVIEQSDDTKDPGTADMLTAQLQMHEKHAWMLASSLKQQTNTLDQAA